MNKQLFKAYQYVLLKYISVILFSTIEGLQFHFYLISYCNFIFDKRGVAIFFFGFSVVAIFFFGFRGVAIFFLGREALLFFIWLQRYCYFIFCSQGFAAAVFGNIQYLIISILTV